MPLAALLPQPDFSEAKCQVPVKQVATADRHRSSSRAAQCVLSQCPALQSDHQRQHCHIRRPAAAATVTAAQAATPSIAGFCQWRTASTRRRCDPGRSQEVPATPKAGWAEDSAAASRRAPAPDIAAVTARSTRSESSASDGIGPSSSKASASCAPVEPAPATHASPA